MVASYRKEVKKRQKQLQPDAAVGKQVAMLVGHSKSLTETPGPVIRPHPDAGLGRPPRPHSTAPTVSPAPRRHDE